MIRGMEREEAAGETLILGGPEHVTSRELIKTICGVFGFRPPTWTVPYAAGFVAATVVEKGFRFMGRQPPVSRRTLEFFRTDNAFDTTRAENVLGFRPTTTLREGMEAVHTSLNNAA
jgi:dihydroflavonol-4-reductase